ncbi:hypothetical protein ACFV2U_01970 [Streptomyces sp. NPDC059697]|uniref:hypothetical protein n=1 Tax=Streptomyces sp. NPDC059697 TaxID=3346912 RepID=UPI0036A2E7D4
MLLIGGGKGAGGAVEPTSAAATPPAFALLHREAAQLWELPSISLTPGRHSTMLCCGT